MIRRSIGYDDLRSNSLWIAAPMVKASSLPFRLTCLEYGAELVSTRLLNTTRLVNTNSNTIDFINKDEEVPVFSTCETETGSVILQLGTADAITACKAACLVSSDVIGIDVNMGCPKSFSVKHGMGAALLHTPEIAEDILKTLRRNLNSDILLTCKIRLLDNDSQTIEFARRCENCGVDGITVHSRHISERSAQPAKWPFFQTLKSCLSIPVIANGDFVSPKSLAMFYDSYVSTTEKPGLFQTHSVMFARGCLWNPSIFSLKLHFLKSPGLSYKQKLATFSLDSHRQCIQRLLCHASRSTVSFKNLKWTILEMMAQTSDIALERQIQGARNYDHLVKLVQYPVT